MTQTPYDFREALIPDEKILWEGEPDEAFLPYLQYQLTRPVNSNSPSGQLIGVVVIIALIIFSIRSGTAVMSPITIPGSVLLVLAVAFVPFFALYSNYREVQALRYALTNKRILMKFKKRFFVLELSHIRGMIVTADDSGIGTIQFQAINVPVIYRIPDVQRVHRMISDLLTQKTT